MTTTVVSWNMGYRRKPWQELVHMGADVALLQETCRMPPDVADRVSTGPPKHRDSHVWDSCLWDLRSVPGLFQASQVAADREALRPCRRRVVQAGL